MFGNLFAKIISINNTGTWNHIKIIYDMRQNIMNYHYNDTAINRKARCANRFVVILPVFDTVFANHWLSIYYTFFTMVFRTIWPSATYKRPHTPPAVFCIWMPVGQYWVSRCAAPGNPSEDTGQPNAAQNEAKQLATSIQMRHNGQKYGKRQVWKQSEIIAGTPQNDFSDALQKHCFLGNIHYSAEIKKIWLILNHYMVLERL